ncbi:hypothetical protein PHYSODRAFT_552707 [Phytophthora sojae]|uniref:Uncharacterized protein n=1 Tax=Phytophthora sojae (strain P6497) TaxID=1094619 RepID=G4YHR8_PHYSP|nr:hypothetical protein PHYSODRAFT_552707 [Phytophthora sojae]EGZ29386.1 hypothetical protein PHYSODRAFT_552707 [Phytophthora sojae]|eukprot:XP_009516661.1 hypothetical protein PHYSODRAFT_552707 [Phytophthora sojae]
MSAVTCHFKRRCRHSTLFLGEYKRTNRTKKTKILRCFPHCCPEHLNRSYCGSSLCVRVELVSPARLDAQQQASTTTVSTANPSSLLVYAHFEEAQTNFLALDATIDFDDIVGAIQTEQTPKGTWIEGAVVRDADGAGQHSSLFQINPGARWYYEWESAATKAQRFTKHALRVYVFQRVQSQLRVVGLVSSSEFMVVSYRRAPSEVRAEREALEALRAAVSVQHSVTADLDPHSSNMDSSVAIDRMLPAPRVQQVLAGREEALWQDRKLWECRHPGIMTSSKQLAILYYFLRYLNASSFQPFLKQLSLLFRDQIAGYHSVAGKVWRGQDDGNDIEPRSEPPLSWAFLEPLARVNSDRSNSDRGRLDDAAGSEDEGVPRPLQRIVDICGNLAGWLALDSANLELYQRFLRSYSAALLDKSRLRAGYVEAVKLMCKLVDRFIGWSEDLSASSSSSSMSLALLCEEITSVVFKYDHLKPLRSTVMSVLSSNTMFGMHEFVAQLRAQFLLQQSMLAPARNSLAWRDASQASMFDGSWVFNGHRSLLTPIRGSSAADVSIGCLLTFMRELARISIRPVNGQSLEILSDWNVYIAGSSRCLVIKAFVEEGLGKMDSSSQAPDFEAMPFSSKHDAVEAWYPTYEMIGMYDGIA